MAGDKETYEIALNPDQMGFVRAMKEKYELADEGKVMRVIMDYLISNADVHESVFTPGKVLALRLDPVCLRERRFASIQNRRRGNTLRLFNFWWFFRATYFDVKCRQGGFTIWP